MLLKKSKQIILFTTTVFFIAGCTYKDVNIKKEIEVKKEENKLEIKKEKVLKKAVFSKELVGEVNNILRLISKNDVDTINNKYVNKKYGFFDVYLQKKQTKILRKYKINKNEKTYFSIADNIKAAGSLSKNLAFSKSYAKFDCSPKNDKYFGWNKYGLMISEDIISPKASTLVTKVEDKKYAQLVDTLSYRVVIAEADIVFYMAKLDDNWYITLFDRATPACS